MEISSPSQKEAQSTVSILGGRDPGDPEFKNERLTGEEFRQGTDTYEDWEKFDIGIFGNLGGRELGRGWRSPLLALPRSSTVKSFSSWRP